MSENPVTCRECDARHAGIFALFEIFGKKQDQHAEDLKGIKKLGRIMIIMMVLIAAFLKWDIPLDVVLKVMGSIL